MDGIATGTVGPYNLVHAWLTEYLVQDQSQLVIHTVVAVDPEGTAFAEKPVHKLQALFHLIEIRFGALAPSIAISRNLDFARQLAGAGTQRVLHLEVRANVKRRVDIDEIDLPFETGQELLHDQQVVTLDENIARRSAEYRSRRRSPGHFAIALAAGRAVVG